MSMISSTTVLIDALGGNQKVAAITGASAGSVSGWRGKKKFPAATYVELQKKIRKMGLSAPDTLWTMRKPKRRAKR